MTDSRLVPLRVVVVILVISVAITAVSMLKIDQNGYQRGLAARLIPVLEAVMDIGDSAMVIVDSTAVVVGCFRGDCP